jgi:TatD DNase family protein
MIDTHCHLVYEGVDPEPAIARAREAGLQAIVTCGYPRDYGNNMGVFEKHQGFVFLTLGVHPIDIKDMTADEVDKYLENMKLLKDRIIAVGEIGLDYHWFPKGKSVDDDRRFEGAFSKSLELAKDIGKPVVLHTRKAEQECFDMVVSHGFKAGQACFHCYGGGMELARKIIDQGYLISLSTNMDRSKNTKKIAKSFPLEQLLTETDSPFLSPIPGQKNEPANVKFVVEKMAELRGLPVMEVDKQTTENANKFFDLKMKNK